MADARVWISGERGYCFCRWPAVGRRPARWLRRGLDALVAASAAQAGAEKPRVPLGAYFGALFRYGLIALVVYVIFKFLRVPLASMVVGMCALAAAAIAASVYELWHSER